MPAALRHIACDAFRERLFDRTLKPGEIVTLRQLCEVPESPVGAVREAFKRLESEGLIRLNSEFSKTRLQDAMREHPGVIRIYKR